MIPWEIIRSIVIPGGYRIWVYIHAFFLMIDCEGDLVISFRGRGNYKQVTGI